MQFKLKPREFIGSVAGIASLLLTLPSCNNETEKQHPNIILFLADDLGYGDLSCYNRDGLKTPAVDEIVRQGVRFTSCYSNGPESSPTRAALLTGRYQQRVEGLECAIGIGNVGRYDDAIRLASEHNLGLPVSEMSIAQLLKAAGYNTALCGKWHLGYERKFHPDLHGFDYSFYSLGGEMDYFHHRERLNNSLQVLYQNGEPVSKNGYFTDLIGEESIRFIDAQNRRKPFFLYVPFTAPHAPFQGPGDYLSEILPDDSPLWNQSLGPKTVYQAMIIQMDKTIDKILKKLEEKGMSENTLVIFMSDNGGARTGDNRPLKGYKGNLFEGGIRVPCAVKWPGKIPAGKISEQPCMTFDFSVSIVRIAGAWVLGNRSFDGIDILKRIEENSPVLNRTLYWRARRGSQTKKAVRNGNMKYIWLIDNGKVNEYLFDLEKDLGENTNLLNSLPNDVEKLKTMLEGWERDVEPPGRSLTE